MSKISSSDCPTQFDMLNPEHMKKFNKLCEIDPEVQAQKERFTCLYLVEEKVIEEKLSNKKGCIIPPAPLPALKYINRQLCERVRQSALELDVYRINLYQGGGFQGSQFRVIVESSSLNDTIILALLNTIHAWLQEQYPDQSITLDQVKEDFQFILQSRGHRFKC